MNLYDMKSTLYCADYSYTVDLSQDELVLAYNEIDQDRVNTVSFGSLEEMQKVAEMMLKLIKVYSE